ncbi:MAG: WG repeat-containing protein [Bacteroidota bacterium]
MKRGLKQLEKKKFDQAAKLFTKELAKNPASAGAKYGYALYFFRVPAPKQNIDSAYQYIRAALADYPKTAANTRKQWKKLHISDSTMLVLKLRIDSLGFAAALDSNRVSAYQTFLNKYPTASQNPEATRRRDALAFAEARRINTYESYKHFLDLYPNAVQVREVTEISELVLYESETRNGTVESYVQFANRHPHSPYRPKADQMAFELFTAPHRLETYEAFVQQQPQNMYVPRAWAWALQLYSEQKNLNGFLSEHPDCPDKSYVEKLLKAQSLAYFPVYEEGKYGFLDSDGSLQIPIAYDSTASGYFCEGVKDDFILAYKNSKLGALDKTGKVIADFQYELMDELEKPLLQVTRQGKQGIVHTGGFEILPAQFDSVEVLNDFFIKTIHNGKHGLTTMNGLQLFEPSFDEIAGLGTTFVRLRRNGRYALMNSTHLLPQTAPKEYTGAHLTFRYDKVEWVKSGFARVFADSTETIVNTDLQAIMPPQKKPIIPLPAAWLTQDSTGFRLWFLNGTPMLDSAGRALSFERVVANEGFYGVKYRGQWGVLDKEGKAYLPCAYDSLSLICGNLFLLMKKKHMWLHTTNRKLVSVADVRDFHLQPADPENPANTAKMYLTLGNKSGKQALYTTAGHQLLPFGYESIRVLGPNLFLVEANRKATLKDSLNKLRLPLLYDGLNPMRKGFVATLKAQKFGLFHASAKKVAIPPQYESLLQFYDNEGLLFIAKKKGKFGLIDRANKEKAPFQFDDIRFWLQSVALVKENEQWRLYDFVNKVYYLQPFDEITYIQNTETEIVLKVYVNQKYGILSSVRGPIIPAEYDDLGNAGDERLPFYVADKLIDTASVYLVFYFDQSGKLLRKQIFSEEVYEKIVCE